MAPSASDLALESDCIEHLHRGACGQQTPREWTGSGPQQMLGEAEPKLQFSFGEALSPEHQYRYTFAATGPIAWTTMPRVSPPSSSRLAPERIVRTTRQ